MPGGMQGSGVECQGRGGAAHGMLGSGVECLGLADMPDGTLGSGVGCERLGWNARWNDAWVWGTMLRSRVECPVE